MEGEVGKFILQAIITVCGAFLAAWLATKRHRSDKWWEKKQEAYSEIVNALHLMKWPSSEHIDAAIEHREVDDRASEEMWEEFKESRRNVWRIADSSSFLIDSKVLEAVQEMERNLEKARNAQFWIDHLEEQYTAVDTCLNKIKEIGKRDLGVKNA